MASSAFSFHCMICFEEFDPQTNYPVVLPCGHTYVCIECANRLDKCMECRTPLHMKIEMPPPPPPPNGAVTMSPGTPAHRAAQAAAAQGGMMGSPELTHQKENTAQNVRSSGGGGGYADRVRNSPGFRRRYGHRDEYQNKRSPYAAPAAPTPPQPIPKQRLPLPKNAVLLSLIQASEPARRRAEVEAPPTPQKTEDTSATNLTLGTPSPGTRGLSTMGSSTRSVNATSSGTGGTAATTGGGSSLPKFSRPSPLFLDGSSSGEHDASNPALQGSLPDDEEHKIRFGTYLEGGPCGTYAVASKNGLLVYPTLFEHTLPSALGALGKNREEVEEVDVVKRDVEMVVKNYYRESAGTRNFPGQNNEKDKEKSKAKSPKKSKKQEKNGVKKKHVTLKTGSTDREDDAQQNITDLVLGTPTTPPATSQEIHPQEEQELVSSSVSHTTWVECCHDENIETHVGAEILPVNKSTGGSTSPTGANIPILGDYDTSDEDEDAGCVNVAARIGVGSGSRGVAARSDPGGVDTSRLQPLAACASLDEDVGLSVSLTISEDDENLINSDEEEDEAGDNIGASFRTMPARRAQSIAGEGLRSSSPNDKGRTSPLSSSAHVNSTRTNKESVPMTKKFVRHFSQGATYLKKKAQDSADGANSANQDAIHSADEFERPLIRLKYGDRVQVVSMDSRGWVKLARGYGFIRLENDKQLVKVGGTSDKACQIEAMLHELSIERNRLKHEQTKLERLSAGLMIDLQSSLLTSDDHVVVPAPEGSLLRTDSELNMAAQGNNNVSVDDIDVSTRSRTVLTPPRSNNIHAPRAGNNPNNAHPHRELRTAKSHSPGRSSALRASNGATVGGTPNAKPPPSPPYGQVQTEQQRQNWSNVTTPTRVNFRTGMSGHRALTSSHSHPHDFIGTTGTVRSMSNHAGISSTKKPSSRGRSIY